MIRITDTHYIADDGKWFSRIADNTLMGGEVYLGLLFRDTNGDILSEPIQDVITNYTEVDIPEEYADDYAPSVPEPEEPTPEEPEPEPEDPTSLAEAKVRKIKELMVYDSSPAVNQFFLNGIPEWFNLERRLGLMASLQIAIANSVEYIPFSIAGNTIDIPPAMALPMVQSLHFQYADVCFMMTQTHKANIEALNTIEEVLNYDYKLGYPDKMRFNL